ncbi:5-formyltetrahydrofolate cyclo-ligase [Candidatus Woesearchaeota archaeon]|nr:5-formyltetrahydrofolate cyclo-ligase [Candidatus Woesearchaeota archaeon]
MKKALKDAIFEKRKALSKIEIAEKSAKIRENLYSLDEFKNSKNILFYVSFNNEVGTIETIKELLANKKENGKNIIVPYVEKNNSMLQLSEIKDFSDLEPKTFGILEPRENKIKNVDIGKLDLVIVPGIAFDKSGHRIGYGHGYYDQFLGKLNENAVKNAANKPVFLEKSLNPIE